MPKLTKWNRESIASRAVAHTYDPRKVALAKAEDALAREAYAFLFPKAETNLVAAVPENWIRRDTCLRLNAGGERITLVLIGDGLPVPYRPKGGDGDYGYSCNQLGTIPHGDLCDRIQAHARAVEALKEQRRDALRKVTTMLESVTTTSKLKEIWPEGEQFYSYLEPAPGPAVPAVRVDEINTLLGLSVAA